MRINKPRCDLKTCRNYLDGNCLSGYEVCNYPRYKAVNDKIEYDGYTLCRVDEIIREMKIEYELSGAGNILDCINIVKEACK